MGRRILSIFIIIIGLILLAGIIYVIFFYDFTRKQIEEKQTISKQEVQESGEDQIEVPDDTVINKRGNNIEIKKSEIDVENLKRMAASFTERFGSYSNHSDYSNILDLKIFMTKRMQAWADNFVNEIRIKDKSQVLGTDIYYGITTKSITEEIKEFDDNIGRAEILVKTQRRESTGTMSNASTIYQDILIIFVKEKGAWKVDKATWQEE